MHIANKNAKVLFYRLKRFQFNCKQQNIYTITKSCLRGLVEERTDQIYSTQRQKFISL